MSRTMRAVVANAGRCVLQSVPPPVAAPGEALITVAATALNRADTLQRKGLYPPPPNTTDVLGLECAGRVGDRRVMALLPGGGYAEQVAVPESLLMDVPPNLSLRQAAAIPETWLTAFQLLFLVANAKAGETVLIHACGSGVGTAATQLAVRHGLKVIGTAGAEEKLARCRELGASAAFNYKAEGGFKQPVLDATGGRGVDVVLDCVGGSHAASNAGVLAMDARWVVYGLMGGAAVPSDAPILGLLLRKRFRCCGAARLGDARGPGVAAQPERRVQGGAHAAILRARAAALFIGRVHAGARRQIVRARRRAGGARVFGGELVDREGDAAGRERGGVRG